MTEERGFRWAMQNAAEMQWLSEQGRGAPPPPPILSIVREFMDEKIGRALKERDPLRAFRAMADLRVVLSDLVAVGHKEFASLLAIADDGLARAIKMMRDHLVKRYLDPETPEEMAAEINEMLCCIIANGHWPNWAEEYDDAVCEHAALRRERAC
jgi:hypothetical protein